MSYDWEEKRFKLNQNGGKTVETGATVPLPPLREPYANRRVDVFDQNTNKDDFRFGEGCCWWWWCWWSEDCVDVSHQEVIRSA